MKKIGIAAAILVCVAIAVVFAVLNFSNSDEQSSPSLAGETSMSDLISLAPETMPDTTPMAELASVEPATDAETEIRIPISNSFFNNINGTQYLCIRQLSEHLGYSIGVSGEDNIYVKDTGSEDWQWKSISDNVDFNQKRSDSAAETVYIQGEFNGYCLFTDTTVFLYAYAEYVYSGLMYPTVMVDGYLWVSLDDARFLFETDIDADYDNNELVVNLVSDMRDEYIELLRSKGYATTYPEWYNSLAYKRSYAEKAGLYYILDMNGEPVSQQGYSGIEYMENGRSFRVKDGNGLWGVTDMNGNVLIEPVFSSVYTYTYLPFYMVGKDYEGERFEGLYSFDGREILSPEYQHVGAISSVDYMDGYYDDFHFPLFDDTRLGVKKNDKWGMVDLEGNIVLPIEYDMLGQVIEYAEGSISFQTYTDDENMVIIVVQDGQYGGVDKHGNLVRPFQNEPF